MIPFKELVSEDRSDSFLDPETFGETHLVDKEEVTCVLDGDDRTLHHPEMGVESGAVLLFAKEEDVAPRREAGDILEVDGTLYEIVSWKSDCGMAEVALTSRRSPY